MTTTAYDTHFIASDIAFTDVENGKVYLNIPFRKVKRIGDVIIGMAGCLHCMQDYTQMVVDYVLGKSTTFDMLPQSVIERVNSDFIAIIHMGNFCFKITKYSMNEPRMDDITGIPTVIGSGSNYVQNMLKVCPNAVVAVLEAIKQDKYTDGDVKYCSIQLADIHNLEVNSMSAHPNLQISGIQQELTDTSNFLKATENEGKCFHANTKVYHAGEPSHISTEEGMLLLKKGFSKIRDSLAAENLN